MEVPAAFAACSSVVGTFGAPRADAWLGDCVANGARGKPQTARRPHIRRRFRPQISATFGTMGRAEEDLLPSGPHQVPKVICVGEALYDVLRGPGVGRLPASGGSGAQGEDSDVQTIALAGGAPANLAVALAKLDTPSGFLGPIGDDEQGSKLMNKLFFLSVNVEGLIAVKNAATRRVLVHVDVTGEREFVGFEGSNAEFADTHPIDMFQIPSLLFYGSEFIACGTLGLAFPGSTETLNFVLEIANDCQLRTVVDVNWRPVFWTGQVASYDEARAKILGFLRTRADLIKITTSEIEFLFGAELAARALAEPSAVKKALRGKSQGVLITGGKEGAAWWFKAGTASALEGRQQAFTPPGGRVVDSTGAGDAFLGGFLSELMHRGGFAALGDRIVIEKCVLFGAAVAAISLSGMGGIDPLPTREEVEAYLASNPSSVLAS